MYSIVGSIAYAQNATPSAVTPTPVPTPTPTAPAPNFQYLPQKAYVQPFAPESGVPQNAIPLTAVPQTVLSAQPVQQTTTGGFDINSILPYVVAGGSALLGKMGLDRAKKAEGIGKEALGAEVRTKEQLHDFARVSYEKMPDKGASITDAPSIKLETLDKEKAELADKAAKA